MPRKEFEAFTRLDASDVNSFLMDQTVMSFAGTAARGSAIATPVEGMLTYLEDSNTYESYNGTAYVTVADSSGWTTFVPAFGGVTIGNGVFNYAKLKVIGKTGHFQVRFTLGSTSAVTGSMHIDVPTEFGRASINAPGLVSGGFLDDSATKNSIPSIQGHETVARRFRLNATNAAGTYLTDQSTSSTVPFTWATGDAILFAATFEVV
jgi:hypothetical protein